MSEGNQLVSVIIPTYNRVERIGRAIDSVLNQTYKHIEIIVVDDGSTDGTSKFLKKKYGKKIRYFHQKNKGSASARNLGISKAKGKWVAFLDDDDTWIDKKLEKQMKLLQSSPTELALIFGDYVKINKYSPNISVLRNRGFYEKLNKLASQKINEGYILDNKLFWKYSIKIPVITSQSTLVKKEIVHKCGGFNEQYTFGEDTYLWLRVTRDNDVGFVPEVLFIYYTHNNNLTTNEKILYVDSISMFKQVLEDVSDINSEEIYQINRRITQYHIKLFRYYLLRGEIKKALKHLRLSLNNQIKVRDLSEDYFYEIGREVPRRILRKLNLKH